MKISFRRATAEDYDQLCELFDEIDTLHRENLPHLFKKTDGPVRDRDYYSELIADENVGLFVAAIGENLVGFGDAIVKETPDFPIFVHRRYAIVDSIVVRSGYRKHGVGGELMDKMEQWATAKGATSIELNVYEFNRTAFSFYERLGYQTFSRKMRKELKPEEPAG